MKIGVFGSGRVGRALGSWMAGKGMAVSFTAKHDESAREAARAAGHNSRALDLTSLIRESEVVLLTAPFSEIQKTLGPVGHGLDGKVLVDVSNPITPNHQALAIGFRTSGAEEIAHSFPSAKIVKAFNATFAEIYAARTTEIHGQKITVLVAGDDAPAKDKVKELVRTLGFDAVDAGPLSNARYLEPLSLLNIQLGRVLGLGTNIAFSLLQADQGFPRPP